MISEGGARRLTLLLIAGVPIIIILAATWLWYFVASGRVDLIDVLGTANKGNLLDPPLSGKTLALRDEADHPFLFEAERPKWWILVLGQEGCPAQCAETVFYTRQIHTAMGKYANRIARGLLTTANPGSKLVENYPELKLLYTSASTMQALRRVAPGSAEPAYVLADPDGWIILSYTAEADGKDIMADLKFLLKNSN